VRCEKQDAERVSPFENLKHIAGWPTTSMPRSGGLAQRERSCDLRTHEGCLDSARLINQGPVEPLPALNSFCARAKDREIRLAALLALLAGLQTTGAPVVLVTHQVTIHAFTSEGTVSGGGSLFALNGSAEPRLLGSIKPD
jgi:hypothetical protein